MGAKKEIATGAAVAASGAVGGAAASGIIGGIGLAFCGTAVGITIGPFIAIGAGLSLAGWGIYKLGKNSRGV